MSNLAPAELGEQLRGARSGANLTQDAAAASLGMARTTLVAIEKGQRSVRAEELLALRASMASVRANLCLPTRFTLIFRRSFGAPKERRLPGPSPRRSAC